MREPLYHRKVPCTQILALLLASQATMDGFLFPVSTFSSIRARHRVPLTSPLLARREPMKGNLTEDGHRDFEEDIAKKLSLSKHRAISALSQPSGSGRTQQHHAKNKSADASGSTLPIASNVQPNLNRGPPRLKKKSNSSRSKKALHHSRGSAELNNTTTTASKPNAKTSRSQKGGRQTAKSTFTFSSLLPPPLTQLDDSESDDDPLSSGLSSWEEFLGVGSETRTRVADTQSTKPPSNARRKSVRTSVNNGSEYSEADRLPSILDLFPADLSSESARPAKFNSKTSQPQPILDGVLPVSDLFYRSSQNQEEHDDEELPFSAEQSDALTSANNKVHVRRNLAQKSQKLPVSKKKISLKKKQSRTMVRRGMEMLVGGVPINADPPLRSIELTYDPAADWASTISLNTPDFGPLLHTSSIPFVTEVERGLFCEQFCHSTLKWDICTHDFQEIVKTHSLQQATQGTNKLVQQPSVLLEDPTFAGLPVVSGMDIEVDDDELKPTHAEEDEDCKDSMQITITPRVDSSAKVSRMAKPKGFGKQSDGSASDDGERLHFDALMELKFDLSVSRDELESGKTGRDPDIFASVLASGFVAVVFDEFQGFAVGISTLELSDKGDGTTGVDVEYRVSNQKMMTLTQVKRRIKRISATFMQAVDDGEMQLALAAAAKMELRWPDEVRERVVEECLFDDDDIDESAEDYVNPLGGEETLPMSAGECAASVASPSLLRPGRDLFVGGGTDGVFVDYSESNLLNLPYQGKLGLRLVEAVVQRAKERSPRAIAIGDVHGCVDELQELLRQCDYRPGDLVIFLGDLVCKGPDSISVVQMAREIGAIGVRGNHDFEVIRWHQAIKSGAYPPSVGSEHFHIASCLSKADMKWLYSLPWYISSQDLRSLFVHAGFVSGIRLAKQNPRLMMNMRSILPDGTVTSKFFNNWPWARLWDGPQTVLFGHDADRGLQQYEHAIGLDTGCVYGGRLTACILPDKRLVSVSARREYFKYRRKHYD